MTDLSQIDQIAQRVDRLVLRYEELERTNALLYQHIDALESERHSLVSRLGAAKVRIEALLELLPGGVQPAPSIPGSHP